MKSSTIVDCKNGHVFRLGLTDDGFRDCPDCGELLSNPKQGVDTFGMLTIGQAWRNKRKVERMQTNSNDKELSMSLGVDLDTVKFEKKLRAIAKHAESLADELDAIDNEANDNSLATHLGDSESKDICIDLSEKQIEMIRGMLNRNEKGMKLCSCDIERIIKIENEPTK